MILVSAKHTIWASMGCLSVWPWNDVAAIPSPHTCGASYSLSGAPKSEASYRVMDAVKISASANGGKTEGDQLSAYLFSKGVPRPHGCLSWCFL
ncbi:hypothetical protein HDV64DRAFT_264769, partial [Trichoderma sp. TUCIM 5745]